jgi:UDP-N-acetylmuramoyl-L-alanyl-D-glutamate--2,6-diaminopimelate ligase
MQAAIGALEARGAIGSVEWTAVVADSRRAGPGCLFVALRGDKADGHDHAAAAVAAGAVAVVCERFVDVAAPQVRVADSRRALAVLAAAAVGDPTGAFLLVGVTGTDGKTSTAMMIEAGFAACGLSTGLLGTVVYRYADVVEAASLTTPDAPTLQATFARMRDRGVGGVVMEVSSHALDQRRVDACRFDAVVFTNLTRDHLDYHGTPEAYEAAKTRLFSEVLPGNPKAKGAVVNGDDPASARIRAACPLPVLAWSLLAPSADLHPLDATFTLSGTRARIATPWGEVAWHSPLVGPHNLANAMAAIGTAGVLGLPVTTFAAGVAGLARIPGRMEAVAGRRDVRVFVDYAHTPKAIENVLRVLRPLVGSARIAIVCGAGGDRDRGKRPLMGRAAATLADRVVVTSDNPRSEDPDAIIREIVAGIDEAAADGTTVAPHAVEPDRRAAIERAIREAAPGDVVVIAGKGHEDYQIVGERRLRFSDVEVAKEILDA